MRRLGCLGLLLGLVIASAEAWSFVLASRLLRAHASGIIGGTGWVDTVLPIILLQAAMIALGVVVVRRAIARMPTVLMGAMMGQGDGAGRVAVQALGGLLLIIPGFLLDVLGILLLLPPVQALFGKLGQRVLMALLKQQMARMFPGGRPPGAGGFPGFPGFPGGPFPGMSPRGPLMPDDRVQRGPAKVVDTTAERVDRP